MNENAKTGKCLSRLQSWDELDDDKKGKKISRVKQRMNAEAVCHMTPAMLTEIDLDGEVRGWLAQMAAMIGGAA